MRRMFQRSVGNLTSVSPLLVAETVVTLALASVAIHFLPFRYLMGRLVRLPRPGSEVVADPAVLARCVLILRSRVPWKAACFQSALCLYLMLQRRGHRPLLHYGIKRDDTGELMAHVWLTLHGQALVGGDQAAGFSMVATFPTSECA